MPLALVVAVAVADPLKAAPAPVAGAVKVTVTPLTGLLLASVTVATNGLANAVLIVALCPPPLVAVRFAGGPTVLVLVKAKIADVVAPDVEAVTL